MACHSRITTEVHIVESAMFNGTRTEVQIAVDALAT